MRTTCPVNLILIDLISCMFKKERKKTEVCRYEISCCHSFTPCRILTLFSFHSVQMKMLVAYMKTVAALINLRRRPAEYLVQWPSSEPSISCVQNRNSLVVAKLLGVMALERHDRNNNGQLLYSTTQTSAGRERGKLQTAVTTNSEMGHSTLQ